MKELILYLAEMKEIGLIADYALGGATALIYYFEPIQTQDVDVFVVLSLQENSLINLFPIYSFLIERGASVSREFLVINNIPVQFLVPYNRLVQAAVQEAVDAEFGDVLVRIPPLEYLMAIMVQTGRGKDKARLEELMKYPHLYDQDKLRGLLNTYELEEKWEKTMTWING